MKEDVPVVEEEGSVREMLSGSGYSQKAIDYSLEQANMGSLADADQVSELIGPCGDTMKVYLKLEKALNDYAGDNGAKDREEHHATV